MSRSRLNYVVRQSLVPLLGFVAVSLFVVNFFTYLSHAFAPQRCTAGAREQVDAPVEKRKAVHAYVVRQRAAEERAAAALQRVQQKVRCAEKAARRAQALARLQEQQIREINGSLNRPDLHVVRVGDALVLQ